MRPNTIFSKGGSIAEGTIEISSLAAFTETVKSIASPSGFQRFTYKRSLTFSAVIILLSISLTDSEKLMESSVSGETSCSPKSGVRAISGGITSTVVKVAVVFSTTVPFKSAKRGFT